MAPDKGQYALLSSLFIMLNKGRMFVCTFVFIQFISMDPRTLGFNCMRTLSFILLLKTLMQATRSNTRSGCLDHLAPHTGYQEAADGTFLTFFPSCKYFSYNQRQSKYPTILFSVGSSICTIMNMKCQLMLRWYFPWLYS